MVNKTTKAKKAAPKTPAKKKASTSAKRPSTEFQLYAPQAGSVFVAGDFNNWDPSEHKARKFKDGTWKKKVPLAAGTYEYLFVVDGEWWADPENAQRTSNPFGSENSIITVE